MAYAEKFRFRFQSANGSEYYVRILMKDYKGHVLPSYPLGGSPVLRRDSSDCISGTSLEIKAECAGSSDFLELYTSDPFMYKMSLERVVGDSTTQIWWGYVEPELYSEPDIAPPYDVTVTAVDGLGELKRSDFEAHGDATLESILTDILSNTGSSRDIRLMSTLRTSSATDGSTLLSDLTVNMDHMVGKSCYEVLQAILESIHGVITCMGDHWLIMRETDVVSLATDSGTIDFDGHSYEAPVVGGMNTSGAWWPVGQLDRDRVPAENSVTVRNDATLLDIMADPNFRTGTAWTHLNCVWSKGEMALASGDSELSQTRVFLATVRTSLVLSIKAYAYGTSSTTQRDLTVRVIRQQGNQTYYLTTSDSGNAWSTSDTHLSLHLGYPYTVKDSGNCTGFEIDLPLSYSETADRLMVEITNTSGATAIIREVAVTMDGEAPEFELTAEISNGARDAADDVSMAFPHITASTSRLVPVLAGVVRLSGASSFTVPLLVTDRLTTAQCIHYVMAKDYALSAAASRWKYKGTLDVPVTWSGMPLAFRKDSTYYIAETFSWSLYEDELEVELMEIPTATVSTTV